MNPVPGDAGACAKTSRKRQGPAVSRRALRERLARQGTYAAAFLKASVGTSEIVFSTWLAIW